MRHGYILILAGLLVITCAGNIQAQTTGYVGSRSCETCHNGVVGQEKFFDDWKMTLHARIHLPPDTGSVVAPVPSTVDIQTGSATVPVTLSVDQGTYKVELGSGGPAYQVAYTYGSGWKQRYLTKIGDSYYILPIQYNLKSYKQKNGGSWIAYNPSRWFNPDGTLKDTGTNAFRATSYDRNCAACHATGLKVAQNTAGSDTSWSITWANGSDAENLSVGCESCHGPAQFHLGAPTRANIVKYPQSVDRQLEVCGQCHFRGSSPSGTFGFPWNESSDLPYVITRNQNNALAPFISEKPDLWGDGATSRGHRQQWQDWRTSKHYSAAGQAAFVKSCVDCHDPHRATPFGHQLRMNFDDNTGCLSCHDPATYARERHSRHDYDPAKGESRCIDCHMAKTASSTSTMYDISSHTFAVVTPKATLDHAMPNSCQLCHRNSRKSFGITDANLTRWDEPSDIALADTLWRYYQIMYARTAVRSLATAATGYSLEQNYPNPVGAYGGERSTRIQFSLPRSSRVRLTIHDALGRMVRDILDEELQEGNYEALFKPGDLASGMYYYRLQAGGHQETRSMLLMR